MKDMLKINQSDPGHCHSLARLTAGAARIVNELGSNSCSSTALRFCPSSRK